MKWSGMLELGQLLRISETGIQVLFTFKICRRFFGRTLQVRNGYNGPWHIN
jgi:hypothetical protein